MNLPEKYQIFLLFLFLAITTFLFMNSINSDFALIDDHVMLMNNDNRALKDFSIKNVLNTFKHSNAGLYHPMVTLSYSLEKTISGFCPAIFHFDNVIFHLINTILVFLIFLKLSKSFWLSFIVTILFAIHPTRCEVVCWISARKDLMYSLFYLLSIFSYIKTYEKKKVIFWLYLSVFFYLLSCLSKSMAITLPFVLLLIDLYTNKFNVKKIKIYLFYITVTLIFALATICVHYIGIEHTRYHFDIFRQFVNFINAHFNILFYLDKFFLPINLYCMYPYFYDEFGSMPPVYILYSPAILYIFMFLVFLSLKKTKVVFYGFLFFIISIFPVSGILPIGAFVVADRYTYIPYIGLFFIIAKLIIFLYERKYCIKIKNKILNLSKIVKIFIICLCILSFSELGYLTYNRIIDWKEIKYSAPKWMKYYQFGFIKKDNTNNKNIKTYSIHKRINNKQLIKKNKNRRFY